MITCNDTDHDTECHPPTAARLSVRTQSSNSSTQSMTDSSDTAKFPIHTDALDHPTVPPLWNPNHTPRIIDHGHKEHSREISLWDPAELDEYIREAKMIVSGNLPSLVEGTPIIESLSEPDPVSNAREIVPIVSASPPERYCFQEIIEYCYRCSKAKS